MIYSVDYPFVGNDGAVDFLQRADLPEAVKEDIAHRNAERLLGVPSRRLPLTRAFAGTFHARRKKKCRF